MGWTNPVNRANKDSHIGLFLNRSYFCVNPGTKWFKSDILQIPRSKKTFLFYLALGSPPIYLSSASFFPGRRDNNYLALVHTSPLIWDHVINRNWDTHVNARFSRRWRFKIQPLCWDFKRDKFPSFKSSHPKTKIQPSHSEIYLVQKGL